MKKYILILCFLPLIAFSAGSSGDLLNSIKRSQMISNVFLERWDVVYNSRSISELDHLGLKERFYHVYRGGYAKNIDIFFRYENIQNIPTSTAFGDYELDLFRITFSSIIQFDDLIDFGAGITWGFAIGAVGYRYGMYAQAEMSNNDASFIPTGTDASQSFKTHEYIYSQTYDDLIVLTNILRPFGYLHVGLLLNQQQDPGLDGMLGSADDTKTKSYSKIFINSNLFGSLNFNLSFDSKEEITNFFDFKIDFFSLMGNFGWAKNRYLYPDLYLGYKYFAKTELRDKSLHTVFLELDYNMYNVAYVKGGIEMFLLGREELEKDRSVKQGYLEFGFRLFASDIFDDPKLYYGQEKLYQKPIYRTDENGKIVKVKQPVRYRYRNRQRLYRSYYFILGASYLADARFYDFGSETVDAIGFTTGLRINYAGWLGGMSAEVRASKNYSPKIYNLVEAYDCWFFEVSATLGF